MKLCILVYTLEILLICRKNNLNHIYALFCRKFCFTWNPACVKFRTFWWSVIVYVLLGLFIDMQLRILDLRIQDSGIRNRAVNNLLWLSDWSLARKDHFLGFLTPPPYELNCNHLDRSLSFLIFSKLRPSGPMLS